MEDNEIFKSDRALSYRFNQDYTCFSIGTERGYKIFETYPQNGAYEKIFHGGIHLCEMLYRSNFLALIGGGRIPKYSNKKVVLWNDELERVESEFKFTTTVINVKLKKDLIFIICEKKIFVFNLDTCQHIDSLDTADNTKGMIAINNSPSITIMAHPIKFEDESNKGYVSIKNYQTNKCFPLLVQEDSVSYMAMDYNGLLLATANEKGNLIRLHSCDDGTLIQECKRGMGEAVIGYISFDKNYNYFGVTSDRGTIHIWPLANIIEKKKKSIFDEDNKNGFISGDISEELDVRVIKSKNVPVEYSFAKIRINYPKCIFCFLQKNIVYIITFEGRVMTAKIDPKKGGEAKAEIIKIITEKKV